MSHMNEGPLLPPRSSDADARDAARYRWLRQQKNMDLAAIWVLPVNAPVTETPDEVDAAIDAAIAKDRK